MPREGQQLDERAHTRTARTHGQQKPFSRHSHTHNHLELLHDSTNLVFWGAAFHCCEQAELCKGGVFP